MVLQRIKREDPTAKAIVFVQWHDIEARVAAALEAHGIPYLWLEGHHSTTSESQSDFKCVCVCVIFNMSDDLFGLLELGVCPLHLTRNSLHTHCVDFASIALVAILLMHKNMSANIDDLFFPARAGTNCHGRSCHIHSLAHRTAGNTEESNPNSLQHKAAGVSDSNGAGGPVAVTYQMLASSVADFHHL